MAGESRRVWLARAAATALLPVGATPRAASGPQAVPWPRRRPTPALALPAWEAPPFTLAAARGQVLLLNFWASWCAPCRDEMPSLELLAQRHQGDRLQVLAVNFRETDAAIRRFIDQTSLTLPILRDTDGAAAKAWQVRIFPTTVAIGRNGRAAFSVVGEADWTGPAARAWIQPLL
jgi:thiol-disulfide isomerase/thioredoxin